MAMQSAKYLRTHSLSAYDVSLSSGDRRTYRGQLSNSQPNGLYRFRFNSSSTLTLALTGLKADANLSLLNEKGKTLTRSHKAGTANELINYTVGQGTYYVRVSRDRGNTPYKLQLATKSAQNRTADEQLTAASTHNTFIQRVVDLTNTYRVQFGLQPLKLNTKLSAAAFVHSRDMALNDFFDHTGSDGSRAAERISAQGYKYLNAGENIAAGYATPEAVVEGWMNSPGHRANILYPNVKEIGVGFYSLANDSGKAPYQYYWTQDFATPAR
ncbi:MAG TPA: CAP domain-containing protein [Coleofasciculaceae cyanobacterium]